MLQRMSEGDQALVVTFIVLRLVQVTGLRMNEDRGVVVDEIGGGESRFKGRGVDHGLERGTHLAAGLGGPVELAAVEVVAAGQCQDLAAARVEHHGRTFHLGNLVQHQRQRCAGCSRVAFHHEEGAVTALQQFAQVLFPGPSGPFRSQDSLLFLPDANPRLVPNHLKHHPGPRFALQQALIPR